MNGHGITDKLCKGKKWSTKSGLSQTSPAQRQHPGSVLPIITVGLINGARSGWIQRGPGSLPWTLHSGQHTHQGKWRAWGLVTFAQVKSAGRGVIKALFSWVLIILLRSQDLECQIAWLRKARGYSCPVFGNVFKVHLSCYVNIVSAECSFLLIVL